MSVVLINHSVVAVFGAERAIAIVPRLFGRVSVVSNAMGAFAGMLLRLALFK